MIESKIAYLPSGLQERLTAAIAEAQGWLLGRQAADGHWCAELEGDTILESEYLLYLHYIGKLDPETLRKAANYIRGKLLPEGGVAIYPGGPLEISASVKAYMVLKWAGDAVDAPHMAKTRTLIRNCTRAHSKPHPHRHRHLRRHMTRREACCANTGLHAHNS